MGKILTDKQREILNIVKNFINENGYSPSVREIAKIADLKSPASVHFHLTKLREKGYINFLGGKFRTITILED